MENKQKPAEKRGKEALVDTIGLVTYSLVAGALTDYASGLRGLGIVASRAYGTAINIPTGAPYGKWRNFLYRKTRTTDKSSKRRKYFTELLAFDTFQVPLYATVIAVGSLASNLLKGEFRVDWDKVGRGAAILTAISPLVGPTVGLYMEGIRKLFGLKSAPKKAGESLERVLEQETQEVAVNQRNP
jgi:hypothetical protein